MDQGGPKSKKSDQGAGEARGGDAQDLLSKLFDFDESGTAEQTEASPANAFNQPTNALSPQPDSSAAKPKFVAELDELLATTDASLKNDEGEERTEIFRSPSGGASANKNAQAASPQNPQSNPAASKALEFGDNMFDGILEEGTIADEKINFFEAPAKLASNPAPANRPIFDPNVSEGATVAADAADMRENTILLEKPALEEPAGLADETKEDDAIDRALRQAFEPVPKASPSNAKAHAPSGSNEVELSLGGAAAEEESTEGRARVEESADLFAPVDAQPAEASANEFAEIFSSAPIQVPEVTQKRRLKISPKLVQAVGGVLGLGAAAAVVFVLGSQLKSDSGLFGYRLEGFSLVKAYRAPSEELSREFAGIFERAKIARDSDDPQKIEDVMASLKSVLERDERNLTAASLLAEHSALLSYWYGPTSAWSQKYDEAIQGFNAIKEKSPEVPRPAFWALERAQAWRALSIRDFEKAYEQLNLTLTQNPDGDDETTSILVQSATEGGKKEAIKGALAKTKSTLARVRLSEALLKAKEDGSMDSLQRMAAENYAPARVQLLILQRPSKANAQELIKGTTVLLDETKNLVPYQRVLLDFRGDVYSLLDEGEKARADWQIIVERSPRDSGIWMKLAGSYEDAALWDQAIDAYRSVQKANALKLDVILRFSKLLRVRGKVVEALNLLDQGLNTYPKAAEIYYEKGNVQLAIYQDEAAQKSFEEALKIDPKNEGAQLGLVDLAVQKKDFSSAETILKKIESKSPNYAEALKGLAQIAEYKHQTQQAEQYYREALVANPKLESVYPQIVKIYLEQEKDKEAESLVNRGLDLLPRSPLLKVSLAHIYQFQSKLSDGIALLEPLRKTHEHLNEVAFALADLYIDASQFEKTWEILNPLVQKELRDVELLYLRARAYYMDANANRYGGSLDGAARLIDTAIRRDPENERYRILAAQVALKNQDKGTAFDHIESILKSRPQNAAAYVIKGELHLENLEYEKALKAYQEALKMTRFQAPILRKVGDAYRALGKPSLAIPFYQKVVKERPDDVAVLTLLGKLYNDDSKLVTAADYFRRAVAINDKAPEPHYYLGFILKELGDRRGALRSFEKYLALEPMSKESATIKDEIYFLKGGTAQ